MQTHGVSRAAGGIEGHSRVFCTAYFFSALSEQLCKAGKTHPNLGKHIQTWERGTFHSAGAQGDPQQGTKAI